MTDVGHHRDVTPGAEWEAIAEAAAPPTRTQNFVARAVRAVALMLPYALVALVLRLSWRGRFSWPASSGWTARSFP
jgi:hypothetical protein